MNTELLDRPAGYPEVVDDATRREFLAGATALLVATACGGRDDGDAAAGPTTTAGGGTRTFVDDMGRSVQVPTGPAASWPSATPRAASRSWTWA